MQENKYIQFAWEIIKIAVLAFIIVFPIRYFLFQPFIVSGESMMPNFQNGNYLIVDEISYKFSNPQRGDVVIFNAGFIKNSCGENNFNGQRFIKRVIGLPGETVDVTNGQVEIIKDGETTILDEKYLPDGLKTYGPMGDINITLKPDQYLVMGDNRPESCDSRYWGVLPKSNIIGKAFVRVFPIQEMTKYSAPTY